MVASSATFRASTPPGSPAACSYPRPVCHFDKQTHNTTRIVSLGFTGLIIIGFQLPRSLLYLKLIIKHPLQGRWAMGCKVRNSTR